MTFQEYIKSFDYLLDVGVKEQSSWSSQQKDLFKCLPHFVYKKLNPQDTSSGLTVEKWKEITTA